jgi:hypothetical protein
MYQLHQTFNFRTTSLSTLRQLKLKLGSSSSLSFEGGLKRLKDLNLDLSLGLLGGISVSSSNALGLGETGADGLLNSEGEG